MKALHYSYRSRFATLPAFAFLRGAFLLAPLVALPLLGKQVFADEPVTAEQPTLDQKVLADLPFGITSFGAARVANRIFVYGGHIGNAHSYWDESQSNELMSLDLNAASKPWQVVATGKRLQGLAMVAHGTKLICIGGFQARNKKGEEHDLHSASDVDVYDTETATWTQLPSLPQGRSSHDAAIIGDTVYVVGGWTLSGNEETHWHQKALSMDLGAEHPQWTELPVQPFERRALAAVEHLGKLYVIGGMNSDGAPTRECEIYDPKSKTWSKGPEMDGQDGMAGFGASGWSMNGRLIVSNIHGDVQELAKDGATWLDRGKSNDARFFHRLLPLTDDSLVAIGGASMESGKFLTPEVITAK